LRALDKNGSVAGVFAQPIELVAIVFACVVFERPRDLGKNVGFCRIIECPVHPSRPSKRIGGKLCDVFLSFLGRIIGAALERVSNFVKHSMSPSQARSTLNHAYSKMLYACQLTLLRR
jgi:hypothetical protein